MIKKIALVLTLATFAYTHTSNNILTWKNAALSISSVGALTSIYLTKTLVLNKYLTFSGFQDAGFKSIEARILPMVGTFMLGCGSSLGFAEAYKLK